MFTNTFSLYYTNEIAFFGEKMEEFKQNHVKYIPRMCVFQYRVDRDLLAKMIYKHYFLEDPNIKDEIALEEVIYHIYKFIFIYNFFYVH